MHGDMAAPRVPSDGELAFRMDRYGPGWIRLVPEGVGACPVSPLYGTDPDAMERRK